MKEKIMVEEKKKIEQNYEKKYNDEFVKKKIEVSTTKNQANLEKMNLKNELVQKAVDETLEKLKLFAKPENNSYKKLLKELILECMVKLLEKECFVKVRKSDVNYVKSVIKDCESEFVKLMKKETKRDYECKLSILEDDFIEDEVIVKRKKLDLKPMDEEEAILEMELLGHNFFVYKDSNLDEICIIYKRKNGNYGLIETK